MSDGAHLLELRGVAKHFGGLYALSGLDLHVDEGEIVSVIGPNGAGKSTMFNVVTGLYPPDDGDVRFRNETIVGLAPNRITRLGVARTFQTVHLFPNMTVLENAMVGQHCRTKSGIFGAVLRLLVVKHLYGWSYAATVRTRRRSRCRTRTGVAWRWLERSPPNPWSCCSTSRPPG